MMWLSGTSRWQCFVLRTAVSGPAAPLLGERIDRIEAKYITAVWLFVRLVLLTVCLETLCVTHRRTRAPLPHPHVFVVGSANVV